MPHALAIANVRSRNATVFAVAFLSDVSGLHKHVCPGGNICQPAFQKSWQAPQEAVAIVFSYNQVEISAGSPPFDRLGTINLVSQHTALWQRVSQGQSQGLASRKEEV